MTRSLLLTLLSAVVLLAAVASSVAAAGAPRRSSSSSSSASSAASNKGPDVDGLLLVSQNASYFSVCLTSTPSPQPTVQPLPSPLQPPVIDAATSALQFTVQAGLDNSCVAWGFHSDDIETVGWSYLSIETNPSYPDYTQSRAAGYLEGWLCQIRIYQNVQILMPGFYPASGPSPAVLRFLNDTIAFKLQMITNIGSVDTYWSQMANLYLQIQGMFEGYTAVNTDPSLALSWFDLMSLQLDVDIGDITTAVGLYAHDASAEEHAAAVAKVAGRTKGPHWSQSNVNLYTHCSSLVKLLPGNSDILIGHDTWSSFSTMLRTFKLYNMPLSVSTGATSVHMSSYPGYLYSSDDWYQMLPSLLTVTETTNDIYNPALYALVQSGSVSLWARTIIANRLATDGPSYAEVISRYNSGTCNNQWIILDHKLFTAGEATLQPHLLTIAEQMPGMFTVRDVTDHLQTRSYWSSFNIPALNITYDVSGYVKGCQSPLGSYVCGYEENFRYLLFDSLQSSVVDLDSMKSVLMYNEWATNPLQKGPGFAIAARDDLRLTADNPQAYGGIDCKITSDAWTKAGAMRVSVVSGPTHQTQPPFCWTGQWASQFPKGQPECFDFPWIVFAAGAEAMEVEMA